MRDVEHPLFIFINSSSHECRNRQDCFGVKIVWIIDHSAVRQIDIPGSINICLTVKLVTFQFGCKSRKERKAVNAHTQNMFSCDVKHLSFRCQTLKFYCPNDLKLHNAPHCSMGRCFQSTRKEQLSETCPTFERFSDSNERTCAGLFFFRSWVKIMRWQRCSLKYC